jgi:hypothetical protein
VKRDFSRTFMGDDAISFSTASIAGRAASACEPVPQSIKARIQTGDVNTDTQNIAVTEFEGQLRNICPGPAETFKHL